jgi:hypothetical protein
MAEKHVFQQIINAIEEGQASICKMDDPMEMAQSYHVLLGVIAGMCSGAIDQQKSVNDD